MPWSARAVKLLRRCEGVNSLLGLRYRQSRRRCGKRSRRCEVPKRVPINFDPKLSHRMFVYNVQVGKQVFEGCVRDALDGKTRILVTNQLQFLPQVCFVFRSPACRFFGRKSRRLGEMIIGTGLGRIFVEYVASRVQIAGWDEKRE